MMLRKLPIRVGAVVRTRDAYPYSLPAGLAEGVAVTVLSYDRQTYNHVVRDPEGHEWTIKALQNLDAGHQYLLGTRWLPADHPLVLAEIRKSCKRGRFLTLTTKAARATLASWPAS